MIKIAQWLVIVLGLSTSSTKALSASEPVKVHFVPHSHMDAGWLETYDEYYDNEVR